MNKIERCEQVCAAFDRAISKINDCAHTHVHSQIEWDRRERGERWQTIYRRLKSGGYGWAWYCTGGTPEPAQIEEGALVCSSCKSRRVETRAIQTRSCDEGQTVFARCTNCNKTWRDSS
jgi:DNA-directed RNA polymerase subunit M/transcription elongation factor TFIIS